MRENVFTPAKGGFGGQETMRIPAVNPPPARRWAGPDLKVTQAFASRLFLATASGS